MKSLTDTFQLRNKVEMEHGRLRMERLLQQV